MKKPFTQRGYIIALAAFLFWPLGIFLLWRYGKTTTIAKIVCTIFILLYGIILTYSAFNPPTAAEIAAQKKTDDSVANIEKLKAKNDNSKAAIKNRIKDSLRNAETLQDYKVEAELMAEQLVRNKLKAPSEADFSVYGKVSECFPTDSTYFIRSAVDAKNPFGVKIKLDYDCRLKYKGYDPDSVKNWDVIYVNLADG